MTKTKELKRYAVTVKHHCSNCGGMHKTLYEPLVYKATNPREAAKKAHEWLAFGGPYGDLCHLAKSRNIVFHVKESYLPRGEGITFVEQAEFLPKRRAKRA